VGAGLDEFKIPTQWLVLGRVADVPKTPTGKVGPADLRDLHHRRGSTQLTTRDENIYMFYT
jgi:hypothetical protein